MDRRDFLKLVAVVPLSGFFKPTNRFFTGLPTIDEALGGGLEAGKFGMVFNRGSAGNLLRSIYHINFPKYDNIHTMRSGNYDSLHIWHGKNGFENGGSLTLDFNYHWFNKEEASLTKHYCLNSGITVLLGVPLKDTDEPGSLYNPCMTVADYVFVVDNNYVHLIKNREGKTTSCKVTIFGNKVQEK